MKALVRAYDGLLGALAAVSAAALGALSFIIAYDVMTRWLGFRPPVWPVATSEYTMLYTTVLAAPWVLKKVEHIQVTTLAVVLPPSLRNLLGRAMCLLGAAVCFVVAWYAFSVTLSAQGLEIRSFEMPKWLVYAPLPAGFFLLGIEFCRHMVNGTLFTGGEMAFFTRGEE